MPLIYADIYNGAGTQRLGNGPITTITSVSIADKLDALRTFNLSITAQDYRAWALIVPGRQIKVYAELDTGVKLLAEGFIDSSNLRDKLSGVGVGVKCRGLMRGLGHYTTLLNRSFTDEPIEDIVDELVGLAGWTANIDSGLGNATIKFDGVSVLKAIQDLAKATGLHFRHSSGQSIDFGALGDTVDLRLIQPVAIPYEMYFNDDVAFVVSISTGVDEGTIVNWVLPLGNKEDGADRATLEHTLKGTPYPVENDTGPGGETYYYIKDDASIATHGIRQAVEVSNDIKSVGTNPSDLEAASDQLYDTAAAMLSRFAETETRYKVNVVKAWERLTKIGQRLQLVYKGEARHWGTPNYVYIDVNELLWITGQTIKVDDGGLKITFDVSNRDIVDVADAAQKVAETITDYNQQKV